jgi:phospholipid/cholesterol/gamma-HCH transport system permease protein
MGLLKPFVFGYIISTIGCYYGLSARGGTQGVGRATTQAMVSASVIMVITDLFITQLLLNFFPFA